jgi:hypothetical protein
MGRWKPGRRVENSPVKSVDRHIRGIMILVFWSAAASAVAVAALLIPG